MTTIVHLEEMCGPCYASKRKATLATRASDDAARDLYSQGILLLLPDGSYEVSHSAE